MNVHWVIEKDVFDEEIPAMTQAIIDAGCTYEEVTCIQFDINDQDPMDENEPIVFYGSLNLGLKLRRDESWIPGVYLNYPQFECTYYYPRFGRELLNSEYIVLPFGDLRRRIPQLSTDSVFIRPSSGLKSFTGKVIYTKNIENELDYFELYDKIEPEKLVIISQPKQIKEEYRIVTDGKRVIAASMYKPEPLPEVPSDVITYAEKVLSEVDYSPDPVWTLDIARTDNELKVLEVGCFSCAGLYQCDMNDVVREVSRIAIEEYKEYLP